MSLASLEPIGFLCTVQPAAAKNFYTSTLGLSFVEEDANALVFHVGSTPTMLRVVKVPSFTPAHFTVFGWETADLESTVRELSTNGVTFERYGYFEQDELGIWTAPGGARVAWFHDPDGNTLSLSQHPR